MDQMSQACSSGTVLLRSVSIFLSNRRQSKQLKEKAEKNDKKRKGKKLSRMDEQLGKLQPKVIEALKRKTHFNKSELETLSKIYKKLVTNCPISSRQLAMNPGMAITKNATIEGIDRSVFRELLHSTFDIVTEDALMERIFSTWEKGYEGLPIRLEGWICGLSVFLKGTLTEKLQFCFRVYDLNGDNFITRDEMFALLRNSLLKYPGDDDETREESVKDLVEIALRKFDIDKDGKISFTDYTTAVKTDKLLLEAFGQILPSDCATNSFLSTLQ